MASKIELVEIPLVKKRPSTCYPQGEFITGCSDIMIGKGEDGIMLRLFYPSTVGDIKMVPVSKWTRWHLGKKYNTGGAKFISSHFVPVYAAIANYMQKPVLTPSIWEAPIANDGSMFPLVVFSHGLASNRSTSSGFCSDLASYGFIVAAVEHRDGSAAATRILSPDGEDNWIIYKSLPFNKKTLKMRSDQVKIRAKECSRILDFMTQLNAGFDLTNELPSNFDLQTLKGKIDLSSPIMAGHSCGGATAILALARDKRFKLGLSLDPWMFPISDMNERLEETITQPMLFILMEKFQTEKNIKILKPFENESNLFYTLRKGTHHHLVDFSVIFSRFIDPVKKISMCYEPEWPPEVPVTIGIVLIKKFLFKNLHIRPDYVEACKPFLEKYDTIISEGMNFSCKKMIGFDF